MNNLERRQGCFETVEHIHTFTCRDCKNWWTYPTMHNDLPHYLKEGRWTCPHCATPAAGVSRG